jgi:hypothetical protein
MTRASQKTRDIARKHRARQKKLDERAKGLRAAGPAVTPATRTSPAAPARPAAASARPAAAGPRSTPAAGQPPRAPRAPRSERRPAPEGTGS